MLAVSSNTSTLLARYDRPVPRYTSYPTVPYWKGISSAQWRESVQHRMDNKAELGVSLYVHVPYCHSLCSFCACTRVISRDASKGAPFVATLLRELDLKLGDLRTNESQESPKWKLREIHLGGGTPTWLAPQLLGELLREIRLRFDPVAVPEISIEIDPRTCTSEHLDTLALQGVRRVSLGVQDFHSPTLKAIKREQPYSIVRDLVSDLRDRGISSINFDLVYGLPYQSEESMDETIDRVLELAPSRIALYSYAHLPSIKAAQKGVEKHGLPDAPLKRHLYEHAREGLLEAGYLEIGMDHFARPEDDLSLAQKNGSLHRNFMGYTVQRTPLLIGLGPSSLSDSWFGFAQNEKDVALWSEKIVRGDITPIGGHLLSAEDLQRREIILDLMCRFKAQCPAPILNELKASSVFADHLIELNESTGVVRVTEEGQAFVRNICAVVDAHLSGQQEREVPLFSRSI
jgi:oxygen-independent coproporphyrinogen III oxidase